MGSSQSPKPLETFTAQELQVKDFPPLRWIVDDILPEGLALLLAPPKYGKSWFAQQLCFAVAAGRPFLGFNVRQGATLYLALESSPRQLQDRQTYFCNDGETAPADLHMATTAERLDSGILEQLRGFVDQHPTTCLIVIDLLAKIRALDRVGVNAYYADYGVMAPLKALADELHVSIMVLHHSRKIVDETDFLNNSSGSNGLTGSVDTYIGIERERREDTDSTLHITGRDVETQAIKVRFNPETCLWGRSDFQPTQNIDPLLRTIQRLLDNNPEGWQGTMTELIAATGYQTPGKEPARAAGRHLVKLNNALASVGIFYERIPGETRKYRFWKEGR